MAEARKMALADLTEALGLLTRLPVSATGDRGVAAAWAWPLVGLATGALAAIGAALALWFGLGPGVAAAIALSVQIMATGGLHEDGLADCADGFWGGYDPAGRLRIMKDSRIGTYGVLALVLGGLIRWQAITDMFAAGHLFVPLMAAGVMSRLAMVMVMGRVRPVKPTGLSGGLGQPDGDTQALAIAAAGISLFVLIGLGTVPFVIICAAAAVIIARIAHNRIGGQTGDVLGATQQITELTALCVLASFFA